MGCFKSELVYGPLQGTEREILKDLIYEYDEGRVVVPAGYRCDGVTIPWLFRWMFNPWGEAAAAAVVHDWMCKCAREGMYSRFYADKVFRKAMKDSKVRRCTRYVFGIAIFFTSVYWAIFG